MIERIVVSQRAKEQLLLLKRKTAIKHWNVLCRWALAFSLADGAKVSTKSHPADSSLEMSWRTFSGDFGEVFVAVLEARCRSEGIEPTPGNLNRVFRAHLHRGIGMLAAKTDLSDVRGLFGRADRAGV